ncbi:hypothetical protein PSHT_07799 [Puccinia striiformis]|uniref:Uncharacterized protein n=1 Tax=Puccinia striiformis TaxID=27350 RepID=A0A2S4VUU1_9BASI|nr:hypothetical protein Pst134EB_026080 [Puccinia striiformis f. sp. tritici]POW13250.1 hypothetical protein PSHT_07799 [Puccinia striiformis]
MEHVQILPSNPISDTLPRPQTSSPTEEYTIEPFVTMPDNDSTSQEPTSTSESPSTPLSQVPSSGQNLPGSVSQEASKTLPAPPPGSREASSSTLSPPASPPTANSTLPPQSSTPSHHSTSSHPDEPHNVSVTVQAIPGQAAKKPPESVVPGPSRGAVIALGVLTAFFVTLIICLLLWRRRKDRRAERRNSLAKLEENGRPTVEKGDSTPPSRNTSPSNKPLGDAQKARTKVSSGIPNPFARPGISRPSRPASLPLDSRIRKSQRAQKAQSQEVKHQSRPASWRSSIASVWESLGLPNRVLHDHNSQFWSDGASAITERSTRNLVSRPSAIVEEVTEQAESDAATPDSFSQPVQSQSSTPSQEIARSASAAGVSPPTSSLTHEALPSSSSDRPSEQTPSKNLILSSQDTKTISPSVPELDSVDSHTISSNCSAKSPTVSSSAKNNPKLSVIALENTQVTQAILIGTAPKTPAIL